MKITQRTTSHRTTTQRTITQRSLTRPTARATALAALLGLSLTALTACGDSGGGTAFGPEDRSVSVTKGEAFTLTVPANPSFNQAWYLTDPAPDTNVLKYRGERRDTDGSPLDGGADGTQSFDFTAREKGRTTVRLLYCPMNTCNGPSEGTPYPTPTPTTTATSDASGSPSPSPSASLSPYPTATGTPDTKAAFYVFTVTVS
ncbi:protease inhibitor I42 family protein [Streptomyces kunmingensis]|uniref:Protease inhibitor I42 family protein n=1 Tax=Streptomyces kunmingensis TaxID=68225 RepID=A0ABU6CH39_9ACTN|nr:protease inhibitor I42 family protein [Streptomyces kunmingensis]MEB3964034.1 protease inhibitor I42 family protein [Streptomyces kunmingensis]